jgi:ABC-type uncharacterized transport system ATPase subunit
VDPDARVEALSVGAQQRCENVKVLFRSVDVFILGELTAMLTPQEPGEACQIGKALRDAGKPLAFITHKLNEILDIADRINGICCGKIVARGFSKDVTCPLLAEMMVGHPVSFDVQSAPLLRVRRCCGQLLCRCCTTPARPRALS